jgi:hypothetical protein
MRDYEQLYSKMNFIEKMASLVLVLVAILMTYLFIVEL